MMVELRIIAALSENRVIGRDGDKPWHLPDDLRRFRQLTDGHPVIMGRRTFQSICIKAGTRKPLPNRHSIVLSGKIDGFGDGIDVANFFEEAVDIAAFYSRDLDDVAYVIGGEQVFRSALAYPNTNVMELTHVKGTYVGDRHFPEYDQNEWVETNRESVVWTPEYTFVSYRRAA